MERAVDSAAQEFSVLDPEKKLQVLTRKSKASLASARNNPTVSRLGCSVKIQLLQANSCCWNRDRSIQSSTCQSPLLLLLSAWSRGENLRTQSKETSRRKNDGEHSRTEQLILGTQTCRTERKHSSSSLMTPARTKPLAN
ncbi:unnamed protein product [Urochloa humidicola]